MGFRKQRFKPAETGPRLKSKFESMCLAIMPDAVYEGSAFSFIQKHSYRPDFFYKGVHVEVKGGSGPYGLPSDRRTAMVKARDQNPELFTMVILLRYPHSKTTKLLTQAQWCVKNGFVVATLDDFEELICKINQTGNSTDINSMQMGQYQVPKGRLKSGKTINTATST